MKFINSKAPQFYNDTLIYQKVEVPEIQMPKKFYFGKIPGSAYNSFTGNLM